MDAFINHDLKQVILTYPKVGSSSLRYLLVVDKDNNEDFTLPGWSCIFGNQSIDDGPKTFNEFYSHIPRDYTINQLYREPVARYISGAVYSIVDVDQFDYFQLGLTGNFFPAVKYYTEQDSEYWLSTVDKILEFAGCPSLNNHHAYRNLTQVMLNLLYFTETRTHNASTQLYDLNNMQQLFDDIYGPDSIQVPWTNRLGDLQSSTADSMWHGKELVAMITKQLTAAFSSKVRNNGVILAYLEPDIRIYNVLSQFKTKILSQDLSTLYELLDDINTLTDPQCGEIVIRAFNIRSQHCIRRFMRSNFPTDEYATTRQHIADTGYRDILP